MNNSTRSDFLKEMGITQWTSRDAIEQGIAEPEVLVQVEAAVLQSTADTQGGDSQVVERRSAGIWWFFGSPPQGDAQILFQNLIRVLGLSKAEWTWKIPTENLAGQEPQPGEPPIVAFAFGGPTAQKLSGERDSLPQLRETVLGMNAPGLEEVPLIASFDLNQLLSQPKDKALLWQDIILARSVLHSL